jgi:FixJ family two-component response regulator
MARTDEYLTCWDKTRAVVDIVHHDIAVLRSLGRVLSAHGYRVCMFASEEQYRRTVEEGKAFCILIDIGLRSVVSGLDLGRAIMSSRRPIRSSSSVRQTQGYASRL